MDPWSDGRGLRLGRVRDAAQHRLPAGAGQFGYHLIEITSRKGNKAKGRHILFPIELAGSHRDQVDAQADSLEKLGAERADRAALDTVSRALKLPIGRSGPVQEGTKVQLGQLVVPDAGVWAFQAKPGATSPVIESSIAYYIFRLDSLKPAGVPPLAEIRNAVGTTARAEKKIALGRAVAQDFMKRLGSDSSIGHVATTMKLPHQEFGPFRESIPRSRTRWSWVRRSGSMWDSGVRCSTPSEGCTSSRFSSTPRRTRRNSKRSSTSSRPQMIDPARQDRVRSYLAALRDAAKVVDNRKKVLQAQQGRQLATS